MDDAGDALRQQLSSIPVPELAPDPATERAIQDSVEYLGSAAALASLDADTYWPKWHSPWWHMLTLHELGEAHRIPRGVVMRMIDRVNALPIRIFPIRPEDSPSDADPYRDSSCHCALGSLYQVLAATGVDVDAALPWIKPWFVRYQMTDGGLSCDGDAYLQLDECPSSMVGTIAAFEAMLLGGPAAWTPEQRGFLERGAQFLVGRQLMLGSATRHNAAERARQHLWLSPCFPRLYFYDVVRGLRALVRWIELSGATLPLVAVTAVAQHLAAAFPDGVVRRRRRAFEGVPTMARFSDGVWRRGEPASMFPLLETSSAIDRACPYLTREWSATRLGLLRLLDAAISRA